MDALTYEINDVKCPNCDGDVGTEDNIFNLCQDPYNGTLINCDECGKQLDLSLRVSIIITD